MTLSPDQISLQHGKRVGSIILSGTQHKLESAIQGVKQYQIWSVGLNIVRFLQNTGRYAAWI